MRLIEWTKQRGVRFVVDESFVDFVDVEGEFSLLHDDILAANPHLCVVMSISKSYGVPGLRLGLLATSNYLLMTNLRRSVSIWNINSFAEFFLQILGKYERSYAQAMDDFRAERERFVVELQTIDYLRVIPSEANYLLCEVLPPHTPRELAINLLKQHNILIKDCTSKCHAPYIRLAVRDTEDNNKLIAVLKAL
jgi:histidinol-phosphate/aromatic aminotransferase/cobyric acid decarboxylase-like protein